MGFEFELLTEHESWLEYEEEKARLRHQQKMLWLDAMMAANGFFFDANGELITQKPVAQKWWKFWK